MYQTYNIIKDNIYNQKSMHKKCQLRTKAALQHCFADLENI